MKFSIILVNDAAHDLTRVLAAISAQTQKDFEVLVVGKQSKLPDDRFRVIEVQNKSGQNQSGNAAKNAAAAQAQGDWLFFLSPTAIPDDECLGALYACSLRFMNCAMFAPAQLEDTAPDMLDAAGKAYCFLGLPYCSGKGWPLDVLPDEGEVFGACSPAILIRREVFNQINGFDEDFKLCLEDADLAFRMRLTGHYAMLAPEAMVFVAAQPPAPELHAALHAHAFKNIISVFIKNMPDILFWPILPLHLCALALLMCSPKHYLARLEGFIAALADLPQLWKKRIAIQRARKASVLTLAKSLRWNLNAVFLRKPIALRRR